MQHLNFLIDFTIALEVVIIFVLGLHIGEKLFGGSRESKER